MVTSIIGINRNLCSIFFLSVREFYRGVSCVVLVFDDRVTVAERDRAHAALKHISTIRRRRRSARDCVCPSDAPLVLPLRRPTRLPSVNPTTVTRPLLARPRGQWFTLSPTKNLLIVIPFARYRIFRYLSPFHVLQRRIPLGIFYFILVPRIRGWHFRSSPTPRQARASKRDPVGVNLSRIARAHLRVAGLQAHPLLLLWSPFSSPGSSLSDARNPNPSRVRYLWVSVSLLLTARRWRWKRAIENRNGGGVSSTPGDKAQATSTDESGRKEGARMRIRCCTCAVCVCVCSYSGLIVRVTNFICVPLQADIGVYTAVYVRWV